MADSILNQAFFGLYEFFANIIPGSIVLATALLVFKFSFFSSNSLFSESIEFVLFVLASFILGLALQGLSSLIINLLMKYKYYKYPSTYYLEANDNTFPEYFKTSIRKNANDMFGTPTDMSCQHIFDVCYIYLLQKKVTTRVQTFLYAYSLARSMIAAMIIESVLFIAWSAITLNIVFLLAGLALAGTSVVFYNIFKNYCKAFAKEVLRSFFIKTVTKKSKEEQQKCH